MFGRNRGEMRRMMLHREDRQAHGFGEARRMEIRVVIARSHFRHDVQDIEQMPCRVFEESDRFGVVEVAAGFSHRSAPKARSSIQR